MMPRMRRLALVSVVFTIACSSKHGDAPDAGADTPDPFQDAAIDAAVLPVFRNPVTLADDPLALQALQILGAQGGQPECNSCHAMTRQHIRYWRALSDTTMSGC